MSKFLDLLEESVVVSGTIALATVGAMVYLSVTGQPIPAALEKVTYVVVAFFFGKGSQVGLTRVMRSK